MSTAHAPGHMEASNAEVARRREYVAGLEAALKEIMANLGEVNPGNYCHDEVTDLNRRSIEAYQMAEAALSGGTSALDAVVAEATRGLREERDAALAALEDAIQALIGIDAGRGGCEQQYCWQSAERALIKLPPRAERMAILTARDARVRAEGRDEERLAWESALKTKTPNLYSDHRHRSLVDYMDRWKAEGRRQGLEEAAKCLEAATPKTAGWIRKLAAQAGEGSDAD